MVKHRVKGRNAMTGLPQWADISCDEMLEALIEPAMQIIRTVQEMLERTPPELMGDVYSDGIILTGGSDVYTRQQSHSFRLFLLIRL